MRLAGLVALAALGIASPAAAAGCAAERELRAEPRWKDRGCHLCLINRVDLGPGAALRWNGVPVSLATVRRYIALARGFNPEPFTALVIGAGADCGLIARVRLTIEQAAACRERHCMYAVVDDLPPLSARRRNRR
jgi:hypothetical protein